MIGVLDFGSAGNTRSVANALARANADFKIVQKYRDGELDGLIIPGVGSFSVVPQIVSALGGRQKLAKIRIPVLCICLGMQAMFDSSEECRKTKGIGIVGGSVRKLKGGVRLPQLGWNKVKLGGSDELFEGIADGEYFYFANSYAAFPSGKKCAIGSTEYGEMFASAVRVRNWRGVQFHPEKSGSVGQILIENFARICKRWQR